MLKGLTFLPAMALVSGLALPVAAVAEPDASTVVARVNGSEITVGNMIVAFAGLPDEYKKFGPEQLYSAILDQLIQQSALQQAYDGGTPRHVELQLENEKRSLMAAAEIEKVMGGAASEEEIRAAYDSKYADGFAGDEYNAAHILIASKEEADEIKATLDGGADFAELAKEKSTGPSGPGGGALGWFGAGQMVPEFETAVSGLEPGSISEPVQTQFGWHVIKLNEKRRAQAPSFEEAQGEIANELRRKAVEDRIAALTEEAEVERPEVEGLSPEILLDLGLIRD